MAGVPPKQELDYTMEKIFEKPSNYSAWHNRSSLLWENNKVEQEPMKDVLSREFEVVQNQFFTDPYDQSAWIYHRWLLQTPESRDILEKDLDTCKQLLEIEEDCKWVLLTVVLNQMQGDQDLTEEAEAEIITLLDRLISLDQMHVHYYEDVKSDFNLKRHLKKQSENSVLCLNNAGLTSMNGLNKCDSNLVSPLTRVDLSHNSIRFITAIHHAVDLTVLNLSHNQIEFVERLAQYNHLEELDLSHNQIHRLSTEQCPINAHVKLVNLTGNPITSKLSRPELEDLMNQVFPNAQLII